MSQVTLDQALQIALRHHQAGQLDQAQAIFQSILAAQPQNPDALHHLGIIAGQTGSRPRGIALIRQALIHQPANPEFLCNLGCLLQLESQLAEAIACFRRALELKSDYPEACHNLGCALRDSGQADQALVQFQRAIDLRPEYRNAHYNLGFMRAANGNFDQAILSYQRALALKPDDEPALCNLGMALQLTHQTQEALAIWQRVLAQNPNHIAALCNLGVVLQQLGRSSDAIKFYQRALILKPDYAEAHYNLAVALSEAGRWEESIATYQRALAIKPDYVDALGNLGNALHKLGRNNDAIACYRRALTLKPDHVDALYNLGVVLQQIDQHQEAAATYQQALALDPNLLGALNNLGNSLKERGEIDAALACFRQSLHSHPDFVGAHDNLLFTLPFHPATTTSDLLIESQEWNRRHAQPLRQFIRPHTNTRDPDRPLRIGYVSPDFRIHPVGFFILPLLQSHDKSAFEVFAYAQEHASDSLTEHFKPHTAAWRNITNLSDENAADLIRDDHIDILIDLAMHTAHNRLLVFARKPAPVQVTYLAYAGGTALDTIDYRLTDQYLDPDPDDQSLYMEKSYHLDGTYWCYAPSAAAPAVNPLPAATTPTLTFSCLNNFAKVSPPTLEIWAQLMQTLPHSRLMLHSAPGNHRDRVLAVLNQRGITSQRIDFLQRITHDQYFAAYHQIDIALDPFPYAGGTTTCDALWMGVPVITLAGPTAIGRAGVSILSNLGLPELIAHTPEQYLQIATDLAHDLPRLAQLRSTLRQRMQTSPLMNAPAYARSIESAYRSMWRTWCTQ